MRSMEKQWLQSRIREVLDVLLGDAWYELTPTAIDFIDEKHFGFEKQTLRVKA